MKPYIFLLLMLGFGNQCFSQSNTSKNVTTFSLYAPQLGKDKKIWIYLPEGYADSRKKYPVIYMHDAQNLFDKATSFSGEWRVDETLDSLKARVIIIGIEHGNDKRIDELTPYKNAKYGGGYADAYLDFITKTLKPEIDKRYRTKTAKKHTGIMGSSLGGLVSYYAVLRHPDVFGIAGVFSPSFWFTDDIYALAEKTTKIKAKVYLMAGDNEDKDMVPDMQRMITLIAPKISDKNLKSKVVPGGKHNEALWSKEFSECILWLLE
jgi:predicted alpha/beta superfamily hydrolase